MKVLLDPRPSKWHGKSINLTVYLQQGSWEAMSIVNDSDILKEIVSLEVAFDYLNTQ